MPAIQYYFKPTKPIEPEDGPIPLVDPRSPFIFTDRANELLRPFRKAKPPFPNTKGVGTLYHIDETYSIYRPTEYAVFLAVDHSIQVSSDIHPDPFMLADLDSEIREGMRISSVGVFLECHDGYLVLRRSGKLSSAPGKLDSPAAGITHITVNEEGYPNLDFIGSAYSKIQREIQLRDNGNTRPFPYEKIKKFRLLNVHHANDHPSGMYSFSAYLDVAYTDLYTHPEDVGELMLIERRNLAKFIVDNVKQGRFAYDGAATLMSGLPYPLFREVVDDIDPSGSLIMYGRLVKGRFERDDWPQ